MEDVEEIEQTESLDENKKIKKHDIKSGAKKGMKRIIALIIVVAMLFATSATLIYYAINNFGN